MAVPHEIAFELYDFELVVVQFGYDPYGIVARRQSLKLL
jgi:hypothetical protein